MNGCASMKGTIFAGTTTGAATGFLVGPTFNRESRDARLTGALIGAVVGGVSGYFLHKTLEDRDSKIRKETLFNLDKYNVLRPNSDLDYDYGIAAPGVETECFDTEIKGDKLVQAHCESRIIGTPEWVKQSGSKRKTSGE